MSTEDLSRPVSPFILQQKIVRLERENRRLERQRDQLERDLLLKEERIKGIERMCERVCNAYDELSKAMDSITTRPAVRDRAA